MNICIPITSRAAYGRLRSVIEYLEPLCTLQIIIAGSATLDRYGNVMAEIERPAVNFVCKYVTAGDSPGDMAIETGMLMVELVGAFEQLKPDFVLAHADRYETLAVAAAASYMNIPLGHTQGGEITGSIDDKVRYAVSMLADIHFVCTEKAGIRLRDMGCDDVVHTGCPSIDGIVNLPELRDIQINLLGHGALIDFDEPYMLALLHPDTTDRLESLAEVNAMADALAPYQTIWLQPNIDAFGQEMTKLINQECGERTRIVKHVPAPAFYSLMDRCTVMVGNSSASIREGSYMGVPAVIVGQRQQHREVGKNVVLVEGSQSISKAIETQITHGPFTTNPLYGDGTAAAQIGDAILQYMRE